MLASRVTARLIEAYLERHGWHAFRSVDEPDEIEGVTFTGWRAATGELFDLVIDPIVESRVLLFRVPNVVSAPPATTPPERLTNLLTTLGLINYKLVLGSWAYDPRDGEVTFRQGIPIDDGDISFETFDHMLRAIVVAVEAGARTLRGIVEGDPAAAVAAPPLETPQPVLDPAPVVAPVLPSADRAPGDRLVRAFISSTFRDMQAERDVLVKRVFPELRRICRARGVEFVEVDLRWGITREQSERGEVLPVCLAEIDRCRPYFIGLIGERYGWVPPSLPPPALDAHAWLRDVPGRSVTELETLHGALNDPATARHAFFYLRGPTAADVEPEGAEAVERLDDLKSRIRASGLPVREAYGDPATLGELVLADFRGVIDVDFPPGSEPGAWDRERFAHRSFARSRTRSYVERPGEYGPLDDLLERGGPPLVVTGPAGAGKSALLANWAEHLADGTERALVYHAVPATPEGTDHVHVARRLAIELLRLDRTHGEPDAGRARWIEGLDDEDLLRTLPAVLAEAAGPDRPVVVAIDGVDQLAEAPGARELLWLPDHLPDGVRVVVTTRPGSVLDALVRRGWTTIEVAPLDTTSRAALAESYLWTTYRKRLDAEQLGRIAEAPQTASPLFLRALLEEVRVFGEYERVGHQIEHYLAAPSVRALFALMLERLERDYEADRPGLVGDALGAIWASRRGLSEPELLAVTGLPMAAWSPLYLAMEESFISHDGVLALFHDELRAAIEERYLADHAAQAAAHRRLADFFDRSEPGARRVEELPFQLAEAGEWQRLAATLADPTLTDVAWEAEPAVLRGYWRAVTRETGITPPQAYAPILADPAGHLRDEAWSVANLLMTMDYVDEAIPVQRHLVERSRSEGHAGRIEASLGNLAVSLFKHKRLEEALACHKEEEAICRNYGVELDLQKCLGNQVNVLHELKRLDEALAVLDEAEALSRRLGDPQQLAHRLFARGQILGDKGDFDGAWPALLESSRLLESLGDHEGLKGYASVANDQGVVRKNRGDLDGAMACYREAERVSRLIGESGALQASLVNQANILGRRGRAAEADPLLEEAEALCRAAQDRDSLMRCLFNRAARAIDAGRVEAAIPKAEEALRIAAELGQEDLVPHIAHLLEDARSRLW